MLVWGMGFSYRPNTTSFHLEVEDHILAAVVVVPTRDDLGILSPLRLRVLRPIYIYNESLVRISLLLFFWPAHPIQLPTGEATS